MCSGSSSSLPLPRKSSALRARLRSRSEEHTSELQSPCNLVCRLLLEKKKLFVTPRIISTKERSTFSPRDGKAARKSNMNRRPDYCGRTPCVKGGLGIVTEVSGDCCM